MVPKRLSTVTCLALLVAGCGGGAGKGEKKSAPDAPTPEVTLTLSSPPVSQSLDYGDAFSASLDGTWHGANLGNGRVYLRVNDSGSTFTVPAAQTASGATFHFNVNLANTAQAGDRTGTLTVKACKDAECTQPYAGSSSASVGYRMQIAAVSEWETVQRDATHNGYVPIRLDPTRFAKAWEWTFPKDASASTQFILRPVTGPGAVFVAGGNTKIGSIFYAASLYALDEQTGGVKWNREAADGVGIVTWTNTAFESIGSPAAHDGTVYLTTRNDDTLLTAYDAATGAVKFRYPQTTLPMSWLMAPTFFGDDAYFTGGVDGGEMHAANSATGAKLWASPRPDAQPLTPAVDRNLVYYSTNRTLELLDRATGNTVASVIDPNSDGAMNFGVNAPILGSRGNVLLVSFNSYGTRKLTSFDVANRTVEWSSEYSYGTSPAVANGTIYALRQFGMLDAIDEATGKILWSWAPPAEDAQHSTRGNVVATKNLVFVSTIAKEASDQGYVYAIDIATRQVVWRYRATVSSLAISANRTLYMTANVPGETFHAGARRIIAVRLR